VTRRTPGEGARASATNPTRGHTPRARRGVGFVSHGRGHHANPFFSPHAHRVISKINGHLGYLAEVRDRAGDAGEALAGVLEAYALISYESKGHRDTELAALLHRDKQVILAEKHLRNMIGDLLAEGAKVGTVRNDVQPGELASYCLHALTAASSLPSKAAVRRLAEVTLAGLHPRA
jgi:hypothetical protein